MMQDDANADTTAACVQACNSWHDQQGAWGSSNKQAQQQKDAGWHG
jgi:inorganic triphosphatase YgiF